MRPVRISFHLIGGQQNKENQISEGQLYDEIYDIKGVMSRRF
jgi:hypothetical protein